MNTIEDDRHYDNKAREWIAADKMEQQSLLRRADRRADMWFQVAMVGWGCALVCVAMLIWMTFNWPR